MFLMPSRFEPCGLSQLISLKYGTIPVVRATGGLDDTIKNYPSPDANGFKFYNYTGEDLLSCLKNAIGTYKNKDNWKELVENAMNADYSWTNSAEKYKELYKNLVQR